MSVNKLYIVTSNVFSVYHYKANQNLIFINRSFCYTLFFTKERILCWKPYTYTHLNAHVLLFSQNKFSEVLSHFQDLTGMTYKIFQGRPPRKGPSLGFKKPKTNSKMQMFNRHNREKGQKQNSKNQRIRIISIQRLEEISREEKDRAKLKARPVNIWEWVS